MHPGTVANKSVWCIDFLQFLAYNLTLRDKLIFQEAHIAMKCTAYEDLYDIL